MLKKVKILIVFFIIVFGIIASVLWIRHMHNVNAEKIRNEKNGYQSWSLKEDDIITIYDQDSVASDFIEKAAMKYNSVSPVFVFIDNINKADIIVFDYRQAGKKGFDQYGVTYSDGKIGYNTYLMEKEDDNKKLSLCMHELGHAIGLAHNDEKDSIMGPKRDITELSDNDIRRVWTICQK